MVYFFGCFSTVTLSPRYVEYRTLYGGAPEDAKLQNYHTNWRISFTHNAHRYDMDTSMEATVEYHTLYRGASENIELQQYHTNRWKPFTHNAHRYDMDTSMEATAWPHQSGPNEPAGCSCASSDDHAICFRDQPACSNGTGTTDTTSATPTVPKAPATGFTTGSNFVASATRTSWKVFCVHALQACRPPSVRPPRRAAGAQNMQQLQHILKNHFNHFTKAQGEKNKSCLN